MSKLRVQEEPWGEKVEALVTDNIFKKFGWEKVEVYSVVIKEAKRLKEDYQDSKRSSTFLTAEEIDNIMGSYWNQ